MAGIYSAKRDRTDIQTVVDIPAVFGATTYFTEGLTIVSNDLYWTDTGTKKIYTSGLDGSNATVLIDGTSGTMVSLAVDAGQNSQPESFQNLFQRQYPY